MGSRKLVYEVKSTKAKEVVFLALFITLNIVPLEVTKKYVPLIGVCRFSLISPELRNLLKSPLVLDMI